MRQDRIEPTVAIPIALTNAAMVAIPTADSRSATKTFASGAMNANKTKATTIVPAIVAAIAQGAKRLCEAFSLICFSKSLIDVSVSRLTSAVSITKLLGEACVLNG